MSTLRKLSVRWSIWRLTVDEDILKSIAPATHQAIINGAVEPTIQEEDTQSTPPRTLKAYDGSQYTTIPAVDIANLLMHAQQERVNQWRNTPITIPTKGALL